MRGQHKNGLSGGRALVQQCVLGNPANISSRTFCIFPGCCSRAALPANLGWTRSVYASHPRSGWSRTLKIPLAAACLMPCEWMSEWLWAWEQRRTSYFVYRLYVELFSPMRLDRSWAQCWHRSGNRARQRMWKCPRQWKRWSAWSSLPFGPISPVSKKGRRGGRRILVSLCLFCVLCQPFSLILFFFV